MTDGKTLCTACGACALACPEKLIKIGSLRDPETKKKVLTEFDYDMGRCMFCGLCEEACPTHSLKLSRSTNWRFTPAKEWNWTGSSWRNGIPRKVYER